MAVLQCRTFTTPYAGTAERVGDSHSEGVLSCCCMLAVLQSVPQLTAAQGSAGRRQRSRSTRAC